MTAPLEGGGPADFSSAFRDNPADPRHGLPVGYVKLGCRCTRCRAAVARLQRERRARRRAGLDPIALAFQADPSDTRHGTRAAYDDLGCRCERCREAAAEVQRHRRRRRWQGLDDLTAAFQADPSDSRHGTLNGYKQLCCRCARCRQAAAADRSARRARRRSGQDPAALAFQADPTDPRHGTLNGYQHLYCRCERCREARRSATARPNRQDPRGNAENT